MSPPQLIFGCASIGAQFATKEDVIAILKTLSNTGIGRIDTAGRYPPTVPGLSQKLLGQAGVAQTGLVIDTKINVWGDGSDTLTASNIDSSVKQSLGDLHLDKVGCQIPHTRKSNGH